MTTRVLSGLDVLATAYFDQTDGGSPLLSTAMTDTAAFGPASPLTVETEIWLQEGARLRTYVVDFNVVSVPEPGTLLLALLLGGLGAVSLAGRKRMRMAAAG